MTDRNRTAQLVLDFYEAFVNRRDFDAAVRYLGNPYVQHRADIPDDLDSLRAFNARMREASRSCTPTYGGCSWTAIT